VESYSVIEERARPVWEKVLSLIGYFDLDPNRALDIILDVFSQHLTTHWAFFLALLSFSPWKGAYRRPVPEDKDDSMRVDIPAGSFNGKTLDEILSIVEENALSSCLPKQSEESRLMAKVLGFKFTHYQVRTTQGCYEPSNSFKGIVSSEDTPRSLYLTAALLIREGFITLEDLYPHVRWFCFQRNPKLTLLFSLPLRTKIWRVCTKNI